MSHSDTVAQNGALTLGVSHSEALSRYETASRIETIVVAEYSPPER